MSSAAQYTANDVLCGKEKRCRENPGNQLLLQLAKEYLAVFLAADAKSDYLDKGIKRDRMAIKLEIVNKIKASGGRFLKQKRKGSEEWIELSDKAACEKVKEAIRRAEKGQAPGKAQRRVTASRSNKAIAKTTKKSDETSAQPSNGRASASINRPSLKVVPGASKGATDLEELRPTRHPQGQTIHGFKPAAWLQSLMNTGTYSTPQYNEQQTGLHAQNTTATGSLSLPPTLPPVQLGQSVQVASNPTDGAVKDIQNGSVLRRPSSGYRDANMRDVRHKPSFSTHEDRFMSTPPPSAFVTTAYPIKNAPQMIKGESLSDRQLEPAGGMQREASQELGPFPDWPEGDLECAINLLSQTSPAGERKHTSGRKRGSKPPLGPNAAIGATTASRTVSRRSSKGLAPPACTGSDVSSLPSPLKAQDSARSSQSLAISLDSGGRRALERDRSRSERGWEASSIHSFSLSTLADSTPDIGGVAEVQTSSMRFDDSQRDSDNGRGPGVTELGDFNAASDRSDQLQKDALHNTGLSSMSGVDPLGDFELFDFKNSSDRIEDGQIVFNDEPTSGTPRLPTSGRGQEEDGRDSTSSDETRVCKRAGGLGTKAAVLSVLALACIIGTTLHLSSKDKEGKDHGGPVSRKAFLTSIVQVRSPSTSFENVSSPQAKALDWMLNDSYTTALSDEDRLLQRFGVATIWYSTGEWDSNPPWLTSANECSHWNGTSSDDGIGLSCNKNDVVELLSLGGDAVRGTIPPEILFLSDMLVLELVDNNLEGTLPSTVGELSALVDLTIKSTNIGGTIPSEMGLMSSLESVDIRDNNFEGTIPMYLGWLESLTNLALVNNLLSGVIPSELGWLDLLEIVDLSGNKLNGSIPESLGQLVNLAELLLWNNTLTGEIPSELGLLTLQKVVDISLNQLDGTIPSTVGRWVNLAELFLGNNTLTGEIPSQLGLLESLEVVDLGSNGLRGSIPTTVGQVTNAVSLALDHNLLTGWIPSELGLLTHLTTLDLSENHLGGKIPTTIGQLVNLTTLLLGNNSLTGRIPSELVELTNLQWGDLCGNDLQSSWIPDWVPDWLVDVANILLSDCGDEG